MQSESKAERRARARRGSDFRAPGPVPRGDLGEADLLPTQDEDLSYLSGDFRIFQLKTGHRWSLDDFMTAYVALSDLDPQVAYRTLDLGCGIGSVLLLTAWSLPHATGSGIEAQDISAALARRSIRYNGVDSRYSVETADFRAHRLLGNRFDVITGTPPYIPLGGGIVSSKMQRGPCCFETRGGIEDYCEAAATSLADAGRFVACAGANARQRSRDAIQAAGFALVREWEIIPREGKAPLFYVFSCMRASWGDGLPLLPVERQFVVRGRDLKITEDMVIARAFFGMPPAVV